MKRFGLLTLLFTLLSVISSEACTNLIVTQGASTDGSIMVSYSADSHVLYGELYFKKGGKHAPGTMRFVREWDSGRPLTEIPEAAETYTRVGNMNEHSLLISETTYGGRPELVDKDGLMDYGSLIYISLERTKTAREAIELIVELTSEYGYSSSGESFTIADPNEVWIMEFIGKGSKVVDGENVNKGIVWVARKVPNGYISAHANHARITQFPLNDPENCIYSDDVISFAREQGYFKGKDKNFSFSEAYAPADFSALRACEARVWSFFNRFAEEDMSKYVDYAMGHNPENRMPLWVKPAKKLSPKEVFDMMRDHYEGTPMDMTVDIGAGGEASPYRWRPMSFEVDGESYVNERAIATQQTGFWFVGQTRGWLPDDIGGILWFGVDDAGTSSLTPIYSSSTDVPECFREGNGHLTEYSPTAAFWVYNRVAQLAYLRYNVVGKHVQEVIDEWENAKLAEVAKIDENALSITNRDVRRDYLTKYTVDTAQDMFNKWVDLDIYLFVKYMDGNVKVEDENGFKDNGHGVNMPASPQWPGYSEKWKREVVRDHGETLKVHEVK